MSKKSHRFRWFAFGVGVMYAFVRYLEKVAIRAGILKSFSCSDREKFKAQLDKEWDKFFKK